MGAKNKKLNLDKDKLYDLYIVKQKTSKEVAKILGCSSKSVRNYLALYEIPIRQMSEAVALERSKWTEEQELNRSLTYMRTWREKPEEEKQRLIAERVKITNTPEAIHKARLTKLKNKTTRKSIAEDHYYKELLLTYDKDDIIRQYLDDRYPFACDFYIKSKDLFIEYQGHQTHGPAPYDETNAKHKAHLKRYSKSYDLTTWTRRDVEKLEIAKQNNINLMLVYPKNKTYLLKNNELTVINE